MVLIISYAEEEHTQEVIKQLQQNNCAYYLMDLAGFPSRTHLDMKWTDGSMRYRVSSGNGLVDLLQTSVVWWRRVRPFTVHTDIESSYNSAFIQSETSQAVNGLLDALPCPWVNPKYSDEAAHHKPFQWDTAQKVGLSIPKTLVTNDPDSARQFVSELGIGNTIFKAFLATPEAWRETRLFQQKDFEYLDSVKYAPVIFQEYIKGIDLRITVVGDQIFAAEIDARKTSYPFDMRMVIGETKVRKFELPVTICEKLLMLQKALNLKYGAIDMRLTGDGEFVFLEVNPAGQWLFVEERTGLPISQSMANLLMQLATEHSSKIENADHYRVY